jgi:hypothetical protein
MQGLGVTAAADAFSGLAHRTIPRASPYNALHVGRTTDCRG